MRHKRLRLRAALVRTRWPLAALVVWFTAAAAAFRWLAGLDWSDAWLSSFYLEVQPGVFPQAYAFWGENIVFGILIALVLRETLENYTERCRLMAKLVTDHTIIIGYTHLGARLVDYCQSHSLPYVLIEKNRELVDDLLRKGEPVIVDDAKTKDALPAANIAQAKRLFVASNNLETALLVTKHARDQNPACKIVVRCPQDELMPVLEKLGADHVYSASLAAFQSLSKHLES